MNIRFFTFILLVFISVQLNAQERRIQEDGKTYVIHVVVKGETIFSLSEAYTVDKKELLGANPDLIFGLKTGQELKIPVAETSLDKNLSPAQKEELPSFHTYRVKRKDGLHFIANKYDVEVEDILKYNPDVEEDGLQKRMILLIPDAADLKRIRQVAKTKKRVAASKDTFRVKTHEVKGDETLYSISKKYNVSIASILDANPKASNGLPIGMMLTIPEKEIRMTTETAPQSGFFTHLIESGETFWSLERKYHVTRDVLEKYNPALENGLLAGLKIKIPVSEKLPEFDVKPISDGQFQKHHVLRGETLYSISNKYGVKISEIKKINPVLNYRGLMAAETILIPDVVAQEPLVVDKQDTPDKEVFIERSESKVAVSKQTVRIIPRIVPESCKPDLMAAYDEYDVALLLPLYLAANDTVNRVPMTKEEMLLDETFMSQVEDPDELPEDTFKIRDEEIIYPRSENFVHFYEGVLLAVDSLQKAGMKIQLHVFDTNQEKAVVDSLVQLDVFRELDLIIGPVFPNLQQPVADFAYKNHIPMVSPLSSSGNFEDNNPYYFKVNPTKDYLVRETADFIGEEYFNKNLIVLEMGEYKHLPEATLVDLCREKFFSRGFLNADREVHFHEYNFNREGYWGLRRILSKDRENVFIIPSETEAQISVAISNVNSLSEDFPVTLVGMSNFQRYHSIQPEYLHHTKLHLLSPYFVDYSSNLTNRFIEDFRSNFSAEPNQFSFQGYDIAFYFMSALFNYGKDFNECLAYHRVKLNQGEFYFDRVSRFGGYMNRGLFVVNYTKNFKVAIDGVAGVPGLMFAED